MTNRTEELLRQARIEALREVRPPGVDAVRRTVHRRRGIAACVGAVVAAAAVACGIAVAGDWRTDPVLPATSVTPAPSASNLDEASAALGPADTTPWVMATAGAVQRSYENQVNDIPAGDYEMFVYCAGEGTVDVVVKADRAGDTKLAAGSVRCSGKPALLRLPVRQPFDGYLRVFLSGDARAAGQAAFSFKFVRA